MKQTITIVRHKSVLDSPYWQGDKFRNILRDFFEFFADHDIALEWTVRVEDCLEEEIPIQAWDEKVADWWYEKNLTEKYSIYGNHICLLIDKDWAVDNLDMHDNVGGYFRENNTGVLTYVIFVRPEEITALTKSGTQTYRKNAPRAYYNLLRGAYVLAHEIGHGLKVKLKGQSAPDPLHYFISQGQFPLFFTHYLNLRKGAVYSLDNQFVSQLLVTLSNAVKRIFGALEEQKASDGLDALINALITVETFGIPEDEKDEAIGDRDLEDKAYGALQIRQPYVDDVNRAQGTNYKAEDMLGNRELSIWVFKKYMEIYATEKWLGRKPTWEDIARIHNGGPYGYKRQSTVPYWEKVRNYI